MFKKLWVSYLTISLVNLAGILITAKEPTITKTHPKLQPLYGPSNRAEDYPALFNAAKFELVYAKWSKKLKAEFEQLLNEAKLSEKDINTDSPEILAFYQQVRSNNPEEKLKLADANFAMTNTDENRISKLLTQYGVTSKRKIILSVLKELDSELAQKALKNPTSIPEKFSAMPGVAGVCAIKANDIQTCNISIKEKHLRSNYEDQIIGHEGVHALFHDEIIREVFSKKNNCVDSQHSPTEKCEKFLEKRADILAVLSCRNPLNIANYLLASNYFDIALDKAFGPNPSRDANYDHRSSADWLELIDDIANCYQYLPDLPATEPRPAATRLSTALVHDPKSLIR